MGGGGGKRKDRGRKGWTTVEALSTGGRAEKKGSGASAEDDDDTPVTAAASALELAKPGDKGPHGPGKSFAAAEDASSDEEERLTDEEQYAYPLVEWSVGMDVSVLTGEILKNTLRCVCIDDALATNAFRSTDAVLVGGALRNNVSVVSLTLRSLVLKDIALEGIFAALSRHCAIRSITLEGMEVSSSVAIALLELVRGNSRIVHVDVSQCNISQDVAADIDVATRYNLLGTVDPEFNPLDNLLVTAAETWAVSRTVRAAGKSYRERCKARRQRRNGGAQTQRAVTMTDDGAVVPLGSTGGESESGSSSEDCDVPAEEALGALGRGTCAKYLDGKCRFGSRCGYFHPDVVIGLPPVLAELASEMKEKEAAAATAPKRSKKSLRRARLAAAKQRMLDPSLSEWFAPAVGHYADALLAERDRRAHAEAMRADEVASASAIAQVRRDLAIPETPSVVAGSGDQEDTMGGKPTVEEPTSSVLNSARCVMLQWAPTVVASACAAALIFEAAQTRL